MEQIDISQLEFAFKKKKINETYLLHKLLVLAEMADQRAKEHIILSVLIFELIIPNLKLNLKLPVTKLSISIQILKGSIIHQSFCPFYEEIPFLIIHFLECIY